MNPELQGRAFPPTEPYLVGREKIREFSRAVFASNPINLDVSAARAAGYPDLVAPPTFPVVLQEATLQQLLAEPDGGIDFSRVVHGEQRFTHTRPVRAGDELSAQLTVDTLRQIGGADIIGTRSEVTDAAGRPVCTAFATLVHRGEDG